MTRKRELLFAAMFGLTVAILIYGASQSVLYWPFLTIQNHIDDAAFSLRNRLNGGVPGDDHGIVIVDIDDRSQRSLGRIRSRHWPRRYMARAIGNLKRDGARLVFLDIIFEGRTRDNAEFADSVKSAGNVIAGYYFKLNRSERRRRPLDSVYNDLFSRLSGDAGNDAARFIKANDVVFPYTALVKSVKGLGFSNYIPDPDGVLRHIPLYISHGEGYRRASASAALQMWLNLKGIPYSDADITSHGISFGDEYIPTDPNSFLRLNFRAPGPVFPYVSFVDVLRGDFEPGTFRDRVVLIGSSSEKTGDLKRIPGHGALPGVEIYATALWTLLGGAFLTVLSSNIVFLVACIAGVFCGFVFTVLRSLVANILIALVLSLAWYAFGVYAFIYQGVMVNVTVPVFTVVFLFAVMMIHRFIEYYEAHHVKADG